MKRKDFGFPSRSMVLRRQIAYPPSLLQQFLYHAQGDSKPLRHFGASSPRLIVTPHDPFPYFQADSFHAAFLP